MTDSTYATAPFDHPKADIILRSSDNIDFRVFKLFLSLASPFFETLFEIPQPAEADEEQEIKDGLSVIPVTDNSKTLDALLRFCYPCTLADVPNLEVLEHAVDVLEAAMKYTLDPIQRKVRQVIANPKFIEAEPVRCFAVAHRGRWREETLLSAKYSLTQSLIPSWFQEIEMISAANLLALLIYHQKCGDAVYALRGDSAWIASHYGSYKACAWLFGQHSYTEKNGNRHYKDCRCPRARPSRYTLFDKQSLQWWEDFMEQAFTELRDKPCEATVRAAAEKTVQTVRARNCQACSSAIIESMRNFSDLFVKKVEETVSQIQLELTF